MPISVDINLPTGDKTKATYVGTVQLTDTLTLEHVLYAPAFDFNLLSVSGLTKKLHYALCFYSNKCFLQDLRTRKEII